MLPWFSLLSGGLVDVAILVVMVVMVEYKNFILNQPKHSQPDNNDNFNSNK